MLINQKIQTRAAQNLDRRQLSNLVYHGGHTHRHLDWRSPVDWIGHSPFIVGELDFELVAALACPTDLEKVAWIRLFTVKSGFSVNELWTRLWESVKNQLKTTDSIVAAIPLYTWFQELLAANQFYPADNVLMLQWDQKPFQKSSRSEPYLIRKMSREDLPSVKIVDAAAFELIWQISELLLETAWAGSAISTVVEIDGKIAGYQISTSNSSGGHLARLAVLPEFQGRGIGSYLVRNVLAEFLDWGAQKVSVNTQESNLASLALYDKIGFYPTGEMYPVYSLEEVA